jgi:hypothetical protein
MICRAGFSSTKRRPSGDSRRDTMSRASCGTRPTSGSTRPLPARRPSRSGIATEKSPDRGDEPRLGGSLPFAQPVERCPAYQVAVIPGPRSGARNPYPLTTEDGTLSWPGRFLIGCRGYGFRARLYEPPRNDRGGSCPKRHFVRTHSDPGTLAVQVAFWLRMLQANTCASAGRF